jgi:hypothetical protein
MKVSSFGSRSVIPEQHRELQWELRAKGTIEEISDFFRHQRHYSHKAKHVPRNHELTDIHQFMPSGAIYFMDGYSSATVRMLGSKEEITLTFWDNHTSIAGTEPFIYHESIENEGMHVPVPLPLSPRAYYPKQTPDRYRRQTTAHLLQVVSMNMRTEDGKSSLLIGLPYVEAYPTLFFQKDLFGDGSTSASSFGVVQSMTEIKHPVTGQMAVRDNGFPAYSIFGIYHILETPLGVFFNKKLTQMELQPDQDGKMALALPPIPFEYKLANAPIPLFDVKDPHGNPVAEVTTAAHGCAAAPKEISPEEFPFHLPDLAKIEADLQAAKMEIPWLQRNALR